MISFQRIAAIFMRHAYAVPRNVSELIERVFFPFFDMIRFGFMSYWIAWLVQSTSHSVTLEMLVSILAWHLTYFCSIEFTLALLEELSSKNMMNLYSSPLKLIEWIIAALLVAASKALFSVLFGCCVVMMLYGVNPLALGWILLPQALLALLCGWSIALIGSIGVICWGERAKNLSWATAWFFSPFMAAFYPLHVLPGWAQKIGYCLPMTYMFENMRMIAATGRCDYAYLATGFAIVLVAFPLLIVAFMRVFRKTLNRGFDHLYN